jgi:hypothetical protein
MCTYTTHTCCFQRKFYLKFSNWSKDLKKNMKILDFRRGFYCCCFVWTLTSDQWVGSRDAFGKEVDCPIQWSIRKLAQTQDTDIPSPNLFLQQTCRALDGILGLSSQYPINESLLMVYYLTPMASWNLVCKFLRPQWMVCGERLLLKGKGQRTCFRIINITWLPVCDWKQLLKFFLFIT